MQIDLVKVIQPNDVVAVAVSGGSDSIALLHYMQKQTKKLPFKVIALNVEHGIRGQKSKNDTEFVKNFCSERKIDLLCYSVDSLKKAKEENLSIEQSARILRYQCFFNAIESGKCNKVATAHHQSDNAESILLNLLRGSGINGVTGINSTYDDKIIRPMLDVSKAQILQYLSDNKLPFVTDETNLCADYTRNFIRLNVMPEIKKVFPEAENSITRFAKIAKLENDYIENQAKQCVSFVDSRAEITLPLHPALLSRAVIITLKGLGLEKDWEKTHVDAVLALSGQENGAKVSLKLDITAIKEYDKIVFYHESAVLNQTLSFGLGKHKIGQSIVEIKRIALPTDLKKGLKADENKIPKTAVIRFKKPGDKFTKFGGGTKSLGDFLTDKKIPLRLRDNLPVLAVDNEILAIFGIAVSEKVKVGNNTKSVVEFIKIK